MFCAVVYGPDSVDDVGAGKGMRGGDFGMAC